MSNYYYVNRNAQSNGDHEVHVEGCTYMPTILNRDYLGIFSGCTPAVQAAKNKGYYKANGCYYCCLLCHTS